MGSGRHSTLMGMSGDVATEGELGIRTIGEEQEEEGLETS